MSTQSSVKSEPRHRALAIVLHNRDILVIERNSYDQHYFTFPAGGLEVNETLEQACTRELWEETSVVGLVLKHLGKCIEPSQNSLHLGETMINEIFHVEYVSGMPSIHLDSTEMKKMRAGPAAGNQIYRPHWMPIERFLGKEDIFFPAMTAQIVRDWVATQVR